MDEIPLAALLMAGIGLVFGVAGAIDPQVGWRFGLAFGSAVGFVPAAMLFRLGTGTRRGTPVTEFGSADVIELRLPLRPQGRSLFHANAFPMRCRLLEASSQQLHDLVLTWADPVRRHGRPMESQPDPQK